MDEEKNSFLTNDVDVDIEDTGSENSNPQFNQQMNNSNNTNPKEPKKPNIKVVGIVVAVVLTLILSILLLSGKWVLKKDKSPVLTQEVNKTRQVTEQRKTEPTQSTSEELEEMQKSESRLDSEQGAKEKDITEVENNESPVMLKPSFDTVTSNYFTTKGEIIDVELYEDSSLRLAQYLVTFRYLDESDNKQVAVYMTSSSSAKRLKKGTLVDVEYQKTEKNDNVIVSSMRIAE